MLKRYFGKIETALQDFPYAISYALSKKLYSPMQGFLKATLFLEDGSVLEFSEVVDAHRTAKLKYRYHYRDKDNRLVFRYDNAPHHPNISTFPHHQHSGAEESVVACRSA